MYPIRLNRYNYDNSQCTISIQEDDIVNNDSICECDGHVGYL